MKKPGGIAYFIIVVAVLLTPTLGSLVGNPDAGWYDMLVQPAITPPNWIFGPVWSMLYALLAVSTILALRGAKPKERKAVLLTFGVNLILNAVWTPIFFFWNQIGLALAVIIAVLISTVYLVFRYGRVNTWYGLMNVPYALWVGFATSLNYQFWVLN